MDRLDSAGRLLEQPCTARAATTRRMRSSHNQALGRHWTTEKFAVARAPRRDDTFFRDLPPLQEKFNIFFACGAGPTHPPRHRCRVTGVTDAPRLQPCAEGAQRALRFFVVMHG